MLDIAWAAGIFEGEGNFRRAGRAVSVAVSQKDPALLWRLKALFGGAIYQHKSPAMIHTWLIHGARARGFAYTIFTFLTTRRRRQFKEAMSAVRMNTGYSHFVTCETCGRQFTAPQSHRRKYCNWHCYRITLAGRNTPRLKNIERAQEIYRRAQAGESGRTLAKAFGVDRSTIYRIKTGECWARIRDGMVQ
jgi:hypothetical protein